MLAAMITTAHAQNSVTLAWDRCVGDAVVGYRLYQGGASRAYTNVFGAGTETSNTVSDLMEGATYFFAVTAYDANGLESDFSKEISYTVPLPDTQPPAISLGSPANGAAYTAPATIALTAAVAADGRRITRVDFYNGATLLGTASAAPYSLSWQNVGAGIYSLTAVAVYDSGGTLGSMVVNVTVSAPLPSSGLTFAADSGVFTLPFVATNGNLSQAVETSLTDGGRAVYSFDIVKAGHYLVSATVRASSEAQNSFYVNIDAEPTDPLMIWDIPVTTSTTNRTVSWRGNGNGEPASSQYIPKLFPLSAGTHQLVIRGREANTRLGTITIAAAPAKLRIRRGATTAGSPGGSAPPTTTAIILNATGLAGEVYNVLCSQDLRSWTIIGTLTLDSTGEGEFTDPGNEQPSRMYRLQNITVAPPKLQIQTTSGGLVVLSGTGQSGQTYNVLCSQDLRTWTIIGSVTINAGGTFTFTDPAGADQPSRMYRLQSITVTPPRLQIQAAAGNPVVLSGTGQSGQTYNVLRSQDLRTWTVIGSATINAGGSFTFTDPAGSSHPKSFYRLQGR